MQQLPAPEDLARLAKPLDAKRVERRRLGVRELHSCAFFSCLLRWLLTCRLELATHVRQLRRERADGRVARRSHAGHLRLHAA